MIADHPRGSSHNSRVLGTEQRKQGIQSVCVWFEPAATLGLGSTRYVPTWERRVGTMATISTPHNTAKEDRRRFFHPGNILQTWPSSHTRIMNSETKDRGGGSATDPLIPPQHPSDQLRSYERFCLCSPMAAIPTRPRMSRESRAWGLNGCR